MALSTQARAEKEDVYIGRGKYVKDDPEKYPSRTELTGGWAGGEKGLQDFLANNKVHYSLLLERL
jgi:hypothetical protein